MASGLVALLDDVAAIAKIAATSLDDVTAAAGKAGSKAVGVVIDDAAVTPGYAVGFTPDRELPIIAKIALGSLGNKFLLLLPGALLISAFAPWLLTPLLMLGGAYLCFEAAEKIYEAVVEHEDTDSPEELALSSKELEKQKVVGAIRTDLILSAEIMAIALNDVAQQPLAIQAAAALIALSACGGKEEAPSTIILSYASPYPPGHPFSKADIEWMKAVTEKSGGTAPLFAAFAASAFGNGLGKRSDGRAGRSNISPCSFGPSITLYSAASIFTCPSVKPGPPGSDRLRNETFSRPWQAAQTSR